VAFRYGLHIGADEETGLIRSVSTTAANRHDITKTHNLIHGTDETLRGDAGYIGIEKREEMKDKGKQIIK